MKTKICIVLALLSIFLVLTSVVFADYRSSDRSPVTVRGDFYYPLNSDLRNITTLMIQPTLEYNLKFDDLDRPTSSISVGWRGGDSGTKSFKQIPISLNLITWNDKKQRESTYFAFGLSYTYSKYEREQRVFSPTYGSYIATFSSNTYIPTASVAYGKDFSSWFIEFKFEKALKKMSRSGESSVDPSMIGICIGSHIAL